MQATRPFNFMFYFDTLKTSPLIKLLIMLVYLPSSFCSLYLSIPDISVNMSLPFSFNVRPYLLVGYQFYIHMKYYSFCTF